MSAYLIADVSITDPAGFGEYRGPKALRLRTAKTNLILVEGTA